MPKYVGLPVVGPAMAPAMRVKFGQAVTAHGTDRRLSWVAHKKGASNAWSARELHARARKALDLRTQNGSVTSSCVRANAPTVLFCLITMALPGDCGTDADMAGLLSL